MCGIIGYISSIEYKNHINKNHREKSLNLIKRRGPDSTNSIYFESDSYQVFLGHTRLAIQDTSSEFNQPYKSKISDNLLVYNGEIYNFSNFPEYSSYSSDTKVLYDLLSNKKECLSEFDGIFSFGFWDDKEKIFYLARDRFGIKPLFYFYVKGFLAFSSSLRALNILSNKNFKLNKQYIEESSEHGYTHNNKTTFSRINKLNKNTIFSVNPRNWITKKRLIYRNSLNNNSANKKISLPILREKIVKSLASQISNSDRGFGFFLSGGTDSSLLVSEATKLNLNSKINTYSLIVPGKNTNEIKNIQFFKKIMINSKNITYKNQIFDEKEIKMALECFPYLDYPVLDISILPSISLCKSVDQDIRVILSGDGADELFAGYPRIYHTFWRFLFINIIPRRIKYFLIKFFHKKITLCKYLSVNHPLEMRTLLMGAKNLDKKLYKSFKPSFNSIFKQIIDYELNFYLPSVLEKVDAASMFSSLEVRVPFLSNNIIEYMSNISISNIIWQKCTKSFLKKLLALNTCRKYAYSEKIGLTFNKDNQFQFIISFLESKKYPLLLNEKIEKGLSKNKLKYIRLLLLKHWLFGFNEEDFKKLDI